MEHRGQPVKEPKSPRAAIQPKNGYASRHLSLQAFSLTYAHKHITSKLSVIRVLKSVFSNICLQT
jgi:hypothetical protein